jgi:hypothetical protein
MDDVKYSHAIEVGKGGLISNLILSLENKLDIAYAI